MGKQSYKEQERQRRENEILRVAGELLAERGYTHLNMDELAEVVGISKPTLYQHFKGKEELCAQVIIHNFQDFSQYTAEMHEGTPLERIITMMRVIPRARSKSAQIWNGMQSESVRKIVQDNPVLVAHRRTAFEKIQKMVNDAKESGEISAALPTPLIARVIFGLQMMASDPHHQPEEGISEAELDETIENVITIFLHGVTPHTDAPKPE